MHGNLGATFTLKLILTFLHHESALTVKNISPFEVWSSIPDLVLHRGGFLKFSEGAEHLEG